MSTISRRKFSEILGAGGLIALTVRITGCREDHDEDHRGLDNGAAQYDTITISNIGMLGLSYPSRSRLGSNGVLTADQIARGQDLVDLRYTQDNDGHKFTLTAAHLAALMRNETVLVETTVANNHKHYVSIDPVRAKIAGTERQFPRPSGNPADANRPRLFAMLNNNSQPNLYVSSSAATADNSVEYCLDTAANCSNTANTSLWKRLNQTRDAQGRTRFVSDPLALNLQQGRHGLSLRARAADNSIISEVLELLKK